MIVSKADMIQAYVFRTMSDGSVEYLLLRRSEEERLYPGMWQMITGRLKETESALQAARREITEETGLLPDTLIVVPYIASFYFPPGNSIHHVPVFAMEANRNAEIRLSHEHQEFAWLGYDVAWRRLVFPGHREGLRILRDYCLEDTRAREEF